MSGAVAGPPPDPGVDGHRHRGRGLPGHSEHPARARLATKIRIDILYEAGFEDHAAAAMKAPTIPGPGALRSHLEGALDEEPAKTWSQSLDESANRITED